MKMTYVERLSLSVVQSGCVIVHILLFQFQALRQGKMAGGVVLSLDCFFKTISAIYLC